MSRSKALFQLQQYDSEMDKSSKRILEIEQIIIDREELDQAINIQADSEYTLKEKQKLLKQAETLVSDHNLKLEQNQKKLYSGAITNPKELEDLQLESSSLQKYQSVLEDRQLEAMLETDKASSIYNQAASRVKEITSSKTAGDRILIDEKNILEKSIRNLNKEKCNYLEKNQIPDLPTYELLRKSLNGIAVSVMISSSCSSCGSSIPSAIAQEARSPKNLATCPTCNRILHPG